MSTRADRNRHTVLDRVLAEVDGAERRALADLRSAGFRFETLAAARRHQATVRAFHRFDRDQDAEAVADAMNPNNMRRITG